jgi:hypothetical protein
MTGKGPALLQILDRHFRRNSYHSTIVLSYQCVARNELAPNDGPIQILNWINALFGAIIQPLGITSAVAWRLS